MLYNNHIINETEQYKMTTSIEAIVEQASDAAHMAEQAYRAAYGEPQWPCGFAWVTIKPANCKAAKYLVAKGMARKAHGGGVSVWNPVGSFTQNMDIKEAGARAFAEVLKEHGINAYSDSRMD
jgi:hypothetical protein